MKAKKSGILRLLELAGTRKKTLYLSGFFAIIYAVISMIPYILILFIVRELTQDSPNFGDIHTYLLYSWIALWVGILFLFTSSMLSHISAFGILFELRSTLSEKVGAMSMGSIGEKSSGVFKKILYDDVERIELFIAHQIPDFVKAIFLPIFTVIFLFTQDWRLALVSFFPFLILAIWLPILYRKDQRELINQYHQSHEDMNAGIVEYVRAIPVMKIFGQNAETFEKYGNTVKNFHRFVVQWVSTQSGAFAVFMSFVSNCTLPILALGLYLYFWNGVTLSTLLVFLILWTGYMKHLFALSNMGMQLSMIDRWVQQIDALLETPILPESITPKTPKDFSLSFEDVSFSYDGRSETLKDISFCVPENSITALVGPSGAGKSTVWQLVARFYDVEDGSIQIGGVDIRDIPQAELMKMVSFVFQENFMFSKTLRDNISMGMNVTQEEIEQAAKKAQIHELITSLPDGYDTRFWEAGTHLSGGQEQRFQIARAIVKNAPILVLDEATAFCDPENEYLIQQALGELLHKKTVIIIAHRLSTITDVDQILVFDAGKISAKGTHTDLLSKSPLYKRMWDAHKRAGEFVIEK